MLYIFTVKITEYKRWNKDHCSSIRRVVFVEGYAVKAVPHLIFCHPFFSIQGRMIRSTLSGNKADNVQLRKANLKQKYGGAHNHTVISFQYYGR